MGCYFYFDANAAVSDFCSTRVDLQGWGYEDAQDGCTSGTDSCWWRNTGPDYIKINGTDAFTSGMTQLRETARLGKQLHSSDVYFNGVFSVIILLHNIVLTLKIHVFFRYDNAWL